MIWFEHSNAIGALLSFTETNTYIWALHKKMTESRGK